VVQIHSPRPNFVESAAYNLSNLGKKLDERLVPNPSVPVSYPVKTLDPSAMAKRVTTCLGLLIVRLGRNIRRLAKKLH
jgi:hypothetical protein